MSETGRDHYVPWLSFGRRVVLEKPGETGRAYDERKVRIEQRNQLRKTLKEVTPLLKDALDRNHFALRCLDRITCHVTQVPRLDQEISEPPLISFPEMGRDELVR